MPSDPAPTDLNALFDLPTSFALDPDQEAALALLLSDHRIACVNGGAGTGKTRLIKEATTKLLGAGYNVILTAPTGKAAKRINELTGYPSVTNHRLLGYGMPTEQSVTDVDGTKKTVQLSTGARFHNQRQLQYDVIICDEYAMVNKRIHGEIIDAMKRGARIRMFGDVSQLRPIEEEKRDEIGPSPFEDMLARFPHKTLTKVHRQAEGSGLLEAATQILKGRMPKSTPDFKLRMSTSPVKDLREFLLSEREDGRDYGQVDCQIITPQKKSWVGTVALNAMIQQLLWRADNRPMELLRHRWEEKEKLTVQVGDKVVYTTNTYDLGDSQSIFNGEVGIIIEIDHVEGTLDLDLGDRVVRVPPVCIAQRGERIYEFDPRKNIELAYALTTHKMQGSEAKHITVILNKSTGFMQSRANLYTAVTRARTTCTLFTDQFSLSNSLRKAT
jgi:exodeoxyribonuclease V alpha subunit